MSVGDKIVCPVCEWSWFQELGDKDPYLCHKCGYDSSIGDFNEEGLSQWKSQNKLPFKEVKSGDKFIRTFDQNIEESELVWHRDREDRIVKPLSESDWMIQIDNELPKPLKEEVFIPKGVYHRVIKGNGDLVVELTKII